MAGHELFFGQNNMAGKTTGPEESHRQTAQFFFQSQEQTGRQTAPSKVQAQHIKSAPMISKRFLQLLEQNPGFHSSKEAFLPTMGRPRPIRTSQPAKTEFASAQKPVVFREKVRGMSAQEIEQYPTDISFDGKPSNETNFRGKLKSTNAIKRNQKLSIGEPPQQLISSRMPRDALMLSMPGLIRQ